MESNMDPKKDKPIFQKGIWIKEQQGVLTMGSLDRNNKDVMVVSDELRSKLQAFETEMVDALYGESGRPFTPGILDMENLFKKLRGQFNTTQLELSFENSDQKPFKCQFDPVYTLIENLVLSSISDGQNPVVNIKATIVQDHLCIIYRDSESLSDPSNIASEFYLAKSKLQGTVQFKKNEGSQSYFDIMIPSGS